jgi:hypothetical protein
MTLYTDSSFQTVAYVLLVGDLDPHNSQIVLVNPSQKSALHYQLFKVDSCPKEILDQALLKDINIDNPQSLWNGKACLWIPPTPAVTFFTMVCEQDKTWNVYEFQLNLKEVRKDWTPKKLPNNDYLDSGYAVIYRDSSIPGCDLKSKIRAILIVGDLSSSGDRVECTPTRCPKEVGGLSPPGKDNQPGQYYQLLVEAEKWSEEFLNMAVNMDVNCGKVNESTKAISFGNFNCGVTFWVRESTSAGIYTITGR